MLKALIVDDDMAVEQCFRQLIKWEELGYDKPYVAFNGRDAYDIATTNEMDVIICDLKMPVMGGLELVKKLREQNIKAEIILLTAYEDFSVAREGIGLKIYDYLLKPLVLNTINKLSDDLKMIATKKQLYEWVQALLKDEYNNELLTAFEQYNQDYLNEIFEKISESRNFRVDYHLLQLVYTKLIDVLCIYLKKMGFSDEAVKNNRDSLLHKIGTIQSHQEILAYLQDKILSFIKKTHQFGECDINAQRVAKIKKYINENYHIFDFSISDISDEFNFSKDHLNRIFKSVEGITVSKYITQLKMERARFLVVKTDKSFSEIAEEVGYRSLSYFTSSFKSFFNITPSGLREKHMDIERDFKE